MDILENSSCKIQRHVVRSGSVCCETHAALGYVFGMCLKHGMLLRAPSAPWASVGVFYVPVWIFIGGGRTTLDLAALPRAEAALFGEYVPGIRRGASHICF